jgi:hypothetical protein
VRKYPGWQHHMLATVLAYVLQWHLRLHVEKKAPALTVSQPRTLASSKDAASVSTLGKACKSNLLRRT